MTATASPMADRLPPQNLEAERSVLGSVLMDNSSLDYVMELLRAEDFWRDSHQTIFAVIVDLRDRGKPVDYVILAEELRRRDLYDRVGGDAALEALAASVPHAANAGHYAAIVREHADTRRLIEASHANLIDCYSGLIAADELLRSAEERIFAVADRHATGTVLPLADPLREVSAVFEARRAGDCGGLATGLVDLDDLIGGLPRGGLAVLAARPSLGKTALALAIARRVAADPIGRAKTPVLVVSLEMGRLELAERLIVAEANLDGHCVRTGRESLDDRKALCAAHDRIAQAPIHLDDTATRSVQEIAAVSRRCVARHQVGLVIVDYLQLIEPGPESPRGASRQEQVSAQSRRLKVLAKDLGVPVLCLAQLNRQAEARVDKRPQLSDLRESGAVEQDADLVLLLHRPAFYNPSDQPGVAELIVAKNRNGPRDAVKLSFREASASFGDLDLYHGVSPTDGDF